MCEEVEPLPIVFLVERRYRAVSKPLQFVR